MVGAWRRLPRGLCWNLFWSFYSDVPAEATVKRSRECSRTPKFTQSLVLLNYEAAESMMFSLDRTCREPEDRIVLGGVTLPAHIAMGLAVDNAGPSPQECQSALEDLPAEQCWTTISVAAAGEQDRASSGTFSANDMCMIARPHVPNQPLGLVFGLRAKG